MRQMFSISPTLPDDVDVYLVLDDFGERMGRAWRETGEERIDRASVVTDLLDCQYNQPVRVVAFNTAEGWSRDVSEDIAIELAQRLELEEEGRPQLDDFIERHGGRRQAQLPLPLRNATSAGASNDQTSKDHYH